MILGSITAHDHYSNFTIQLYVSLPLWFPELSPASATSFSKYQLTTTEPQQFSN
jgi:hypothetical protein